MKALTTKGLIKELRHNCRILGNDEIVCTLIYNKETDRFGILALADGLLQEAEEDYIG